MNARWLVIGGLFTGVAAWIFYRTQQGETPLPDIVGGIMSSIRGIRNNNPGNLEYNASINWQGQIGQDADGYCTFDTMVNGIRALRIDLQNAQRLHGRNTVYDIITNFSATDQEAYVANVSKALGVDAHDTIDMSDPDTLNTFIDTVIKQETGEAGYLIALPSISAGLTA